MWRYLALALVAGCVSPSSVVCSDGRVCPAGAMCVSVGGFPSCATDADLAACTNHAEGESCDIASERKACRDGVCIDTCGNGHTEPYETCDDGNQVAGDACSTTCHVEGCGNGELDLVLGEECDVGAAGVSGDGCSSTCKIEQPVWTELVQTDTIGPRASTASATLNGVVVLFGGIGPTGTLDQTWSWRSVGGQPPFWHQLFPARSPSARHGHAMTYDSQRNRIVMFGGYSPAGVLDDTWEWDGEVWIDVSPASRPGGRTDMALAYDAARHVTVMYGGTTPSGPLQDTNEWDGTAWKNLSTLTPPPPNRFVQLAYDATARELIYCGMPDTPATWKYDGTAWTNLNVPCPSSGTVVPAPHRMIYDPLRATLLVTLATGEVYVWNAINRQWNADGNVGSTWLYGATLAHDGASLIVFGGHETGNYSDTPRFRSQSFTRATPTAAFGFYNPPAFFFQPRQRAALAFDSKRLRAVLQGGVVGSFSNTTWLFDYQRWQLDKYPATYSLAPRYDTPATYDSDRDVVVSFGGVSGDRILAPPLQLLDQTYEMTPDVFWTQKSPATKPSPRRGVAIVYDAARKRTLMFGGDGDANQTTGTRLDDTWTWDGTNWQPLSPPMSPPARSHAAIAYDPERELVVMFGGRSGLTGYLDDTWEWDGTTWTLRDSSQLSVVVPPPRADAALVFDPLRHRIVLLGGGSVAQDGAHYSDVWEWDGTHWTKTFDDPRLARVAAHTFFDPLYGGIVTFGGNISNTEGTTGTTWLLRWESLAKRETCRLADDPDVDGDGLAGCADPDCAPRCRTCGDGTCDLHEDRLICPADC